MKLNDLPHRLLLLHHPALSLWHLSLWHLSRQVLPAYAQSSGELLQQRPLPHLKHQHLWMLIHPRSQKVPSNVSSLLAMTTRTALSVCQTLCDRQSIRWDVSLLMLIRPLPPRQGGPSVSAHMLPTVVANPMGEGGGDSLLCFFAALVAAAGEAAARANQPSFISHPWSRRSFASKDLATPRDRFSYVFWPRSTSRRHTGQIDAEGEPPMFHGTEWGSAARILMHSAGFIVGPGTHNVRGKAWSGCWCVPTLGDALSRASPGRYSVDGEFSRFSCPVVLEIRAAWLRHVPCSWMRAC